MIVLRPEKPRPMENKSDMKEKDKETQTDKLSCTFPGVQKLCHNFSLQVTFEREKPIPGSILSVPYCCSVDNSSSTTRGITHFYCNIAS